MSAAQGALAWVQPAGRLAGPVLVLLILAMMVLPLPPFALDVLFTFNIALAMIVLLVSLNASRPLDFSVFPTVLLLTTLLRLSLNVASVRLVLMQGQTGPAAAGRVIESFGNFLVGGNYAVGLVVFVILVIINFVVITRGAGRIAEVAARFTLDALPGKQLAIDADLNAGFVNEQEARARRTDLAKESDFYGAMDGASKFVRGDAVAAIIIMAVNLVGGVSLGLFQYGMGIAEAFNRYGLLTVGDGLVAQIPALVISTAAGIVVSRATYEQDLSREFLLQVFGRPQSLYVAGAVLALLGILPGTPHLAFLLIGTLLLGAAQWQQRSARRAAAAEEEEIPQGEEETLAEVTWDDVPPVDVLALEVGYRLIPLLDRQQDGILLQRITEGRRRFALEMGVVVPPIRVRDNLQLKPNQYRITLKGVEMVRGEVFPGRVLVLDAEEEYSGKAGQDPLSGIPGLWLTEEEAQGDEAALRPADVIARHLEAVYRAHAGELLGRSELAQLLESVSRSTPGLVEEAIPRLLPLSLVQGLLQNLVNEGVSIRDVRTILETLAAQGARTQNLEELTETVRAALGRAIVDRLFEGAETLHVIALAETAEAGLLKEMGEEGEALISPQLSEALSEGAQIALAEQLEEGYPGVLLVQPVLRPVVARILRRGQVALAVISYAEIPLEKTVEIGNELRLAA